MEIKSKLNCPLDSFNPCKQLDCAWFMKVSGKNPQTGQEIDEWGCAITWLPIMLVENSQQQRQTGAAVESFRNEMVKSNEATTKALFLSMGSNNSTYLIEKD